MRRGCRHGPCDRELGSVGANALVVAAARGAVVQVIDDVELEVEGHGEGYIDCLRSVRAAVNRPEH